MRLTEGVKMAWLQGLRRCACWWQGRQDKRRRGGIAASRVDAHGPKHA